MYRVFKRAWWADEACTIPVEQLDEGETITVVATEDHARLRCATYNYRNGERVQRPYGLAYEYERL